MSLVINGTINLFDYIDHDTVERVCTVAVIPEQTAKEWEGQRLHVLNWKISDDRKTVLLTYQTRNDSYAAILDVVLPIRVDRYKLQPPTKSRNWQLEKFSDFWRNQKTGERVSA